MYLFMYVKMNLVTKNTLKIYKEAIENYNDIRIATPLAGGYPLLARTLYSIIFAILYV